MKLNENWLFHFLRKIEKRFGGIVHGPFWPWIAGNLSVVSILFSNGKSNRSFNNFLAWHCRQLIRCFNSFLKGEIEPLLQQVFSLAL